MTGRPIDELYSGTMLKSITNAQMATSVDHHWRTPRCIVGSVRWARCVRQWPRLWTISSKSVRRAIFFGKWPHWSSIAENTEAWNAKLCLCVAGHCCESRMSLSGFSPTGCGEPQFSPSWRHNAPGLEVEGLQFG